MELIEEFEKKFEELRKELGFKATLEDLDSRFYLRDYMQKEKVVYYSLSRAIRSRINEVFNSWLGYIHGLILPNPNSMVNLSESQAFTDEEKKDFNNIIIKGMAFINKNNLINLTKNKKDEASFIDEGVALWDELKPSFKEITEKVIGSWEEKKKELT